MPLYQLDGHRVVTNGPGSYWVADTARVMGNVVLAEDVSIWFGAVVRGDNEPIRIGRGTNIQDGAVLHSDPGFPLSIGEDCTIGHMVMLHGCTLAAGVLVGIGAIVLNGAKIGEGSMIGAGSLIPEGREIPPRSLVFGSPGKIIRQIDDANAARIRSGAAHYVRNWKQFAAGLRPQAE